MRILTAIVSVLAILAGLSSVWLHRPAVDGSLDKRAFSSIAIAPREQAITLAVTGAGAVLLVTLADVDTVTAIDVSAATGQSFSDAIEAYAFTKERGLRALYGTHTQTRYSWDSLVVPVTPRFPNIAAGTNYRAHAEEVGREDGPFLFPKLSIPTRWNSGVRPGARLDFEVELCALPMAAYRRETSTPLGYLLCGDYTDRWLLVRDIDLDGPMGQTGFALAKGGESHLPVGPLLVIPRDEDFYRHIQLSLYMNSQLRQQALAETMIWSPDQILDHAMADCDSPYAAGEEIFYLTDCEYIPAGTLVLTGTPGGVLFNLATLWNPWVYLREGDVVTSFGTYLGFMRNEIRSE